MKPILEWLNEAKAQGCEWADAAIRNYDPKFMPIRKTNSLIASLENAFVWDGSPEGHDYWRNVIESLRPAEEEEMPALEDLIQKLEKLNNAIRDLEYNNALVEPYHTQVYEATKASYEEQLAEVKVKIAKMLCIEPIKERKLIGWVVQGQDGVYCKYTAPVVTKDNRGWAITKWGGWSGITTEEAASLCDRLPKWSDNDPTPIYQ